MEAATRRHTTARRYRIGPDRVDERDGAVTIDAARGMPDWTVSRYRPVAVDLASGRYAVRSAEPAEPSGNGRWRYELTPWRFEDGDRPAREIRFDTAYVEHREARSRALRTSALSSILVLPLTPVLGLLPSPAKAWLQRRAAFEPRSATAASVVLEALGCAALAGLLMIHWMTGTALTSGLDGLGWWLAFALTDAGIRHGAMLDEDAPAFGVGEWLWPGHWRGLR